MTLKELKARFDATLKARKDKTDEIERLKAEREDVAAKMLNAADQGDLEGYKKLEDQKRDLDARIFVYSRSLPSAGNPVTREEVVKAWDGFTKTYNKDTEAKYKAFLSECRALAGKYKALVNIQNAALYEKEKALEIMGEAVNSDALKMYMIPTGAENDDLTEAATRWTRYTSIIELPFFVGIGAITQDEAERIDRIIESGFSSQD